MPSFSSTSAARMPSQVEAILISTRSREMPAASYRAMSSRPLAMVASVSKERRASVSVETRPGTILRISRPNATSRRSMMSPVEPPEVAHRLFQQRPVFRLLHGLQDQRRIGGRILRRIGFDRLEVAGVGHDGGELLELL